MNLEEGNQDNSEDFGLDFETLVVALLLPLEDLGAQLYQLAWAENFGSGRIEQRLRQLKVSDLESNQFGHYHWVFYLPPRNALNNVLKAVLPVMMKTEKMGFFKRAAMRSAIFVFKPAIKKAMEGVRKGMLFLTVLRTRSDYNDEEIMSLTGAYIEVLMPDFKFNGSTQQRRALEAIKAKKQENAKYAKHPFVTPSRLVDFDAASYDQFVGNYTDIRKDEKKTTHRFARDGDTFSWQYHEQEPMVFHPAGDRLFVIEDGKMTSEFQMDESGKLTGVEER